MLTTAGYAGVLGPSFGVSRSSFKRSPSRDIGPHKGLKAFLRGRTQDPMRSQAPQEDTMLKGSKDLTRRYVTTTIITIPSIETLHTPYLGPVDP